MEVGLFGLQTTTRRVAAVISLQHPVEIVAVLGVDRNGLASRAPDAAARCG